MMTDEMVESLLEDGLYCIISEYMEHWGMSPDQMINLCEKVIKDTVRWNRIMKKYDYRTSYPNMDILFNAYTTEMQERLNAQYGIANMEGI